MHKDALYVVKYIYAVVYFILSQQEKFFFFKTN